LRKTDTLIYALCVNITTKHTLYIKAEQQFTQYVQI